FLPGLLACLFLAFLALRMILFPLGTESLLHRLAAGFHVRTRRFPRLHAAHRGVAADTAAMFEEAQIELAPARVPVDHLSPGAIGAGAGARGAMRGPVRGPRRTPVRSSNCQKSWGRSETRIMPSTRKRVDWTKTPKPVTPVTTPSITSPTCSARSCSTFTCRS